MAGLTILVDEIERWVELELNLGPADDGAIVLECYAAVPWRCIHAGCRQQTDGYLVFTSRLVDG